MKVRSIHIQDYRSIEDSGVLKLGPITLLVGRNNTGKSSVIKALHAIQASGALEPMDVRYGSGTGTVIKYELADANPALWNSPGNQTADATLQINMLSDGNGSTPTLELVGGPAQAVGPIQAFEPQNFIYPYLAGRKVAAFEEIIDQSRSLEVRSNLSNLASKVDRLMDVNHPMHAQFVTLVDEVINLRLSAIASPGGKQVGMWVDVTAWIELSRMGDGVAQMLGLITQLCMANQKLLLIEELENDIHPDGLKSLLRVIEQQAGQNQFVISTHNNIVVRHLGALAETKIYNVESTMVESAGRRLPLSSMALVGNDVQERVQLLNSLGYEFSDFDLYDGWLILEEASAERLIRDHLIRWFAPKLRGVRTVASRGTGDLERSFEALEKLVLFTHLQEAYRGRICVIADGEPSGQDAIRRLKERYKSWPASSFRLFGEADFELYYPDVFQPKARSVLALKGNHKREAKKALLEELLQWIEADDARAREAFRTSAASVIAELNAFESSLVARGR